MDSGEYNFILISNLSGGMKEAFRNRCIEFIFDPYEEEDMIAIVNNFLQKYHLTRDLVERIALRTRNNPRVAKIICERLQYIFNNHLIPKTIDELELILNNILYIREDGLNRQDDLYLDFLRRSGICSLETLSRGTGLDKETIQREIEPYLLYLGKIKITSRGRIINERRDVD
jgi:Holliday junction resolvasome RuvABC ATP-dependent DNA helicase subunit